MTESEKMGALRTAIAPDTDSDAVLTGILLEAEALILNRMYPFGYDEGRVVPHQYERIQIALAVELYSKRGAEGQTSHQENGINRQWSTESALLKGITPHVGSVYRDA